MANRKIVLIYDDADMRALTRLMLSRNNSLEIIEEGSGEQGLAAVRQARPDIVLLDLMLPDIDGWDVCRRLKADPQTAGIPIIILSARSEVQNNKVYAFQVMRVAGYISKTFSVGELLDCINTALSGKNAARDQ